VEGVAGGKSHPGRVRREPGTGEGVTKERAVVASSEYRVPSLK
jgi:hypothetical protein